MSTITTINGSDTITSSRTVINTNFSNLNTDKIETSVLDTDTALTANSDAKVATQKAVKAYVDGVGVANATTAIKGIVEVATQAEVAAGTATGGTGASLVVTPATLFGLSAPTSQVFTASGTYTKPSGLRYAVIEGVGGGCGGNSSLPGRGGSGGGYFRKLITAASIGATETVTIGAGSVAALGGAANGGNTTFGALLTGNGGGATAGGTATGGDVNITGGVGATQSSGTGANYALGGSSMLGIGCNGTPTGYGAGGADTAGGTNGIIIVTEHYF